jgi:hypothetical protein
MTKTITLTLAEKEARWLATAVTVLRRVLQNISSPDAELSDYRLEGLAILHRIAGVLPPGFYL